MIKRRVVMGSPSCIAFSGGRGCPSCLCLGIYQEEKEPKWGQNIVGPSRGLGASLPCAGRALVLKLGGSYGGWILPKDITHLLKTPQQARGCRAAVTAKRVALLLLACPTEPVGQGHPREGATEVTLMGPPRVCAKYQLLGCSWGMLLAPAHGTKTQGLILALLKAKLPLGWPGGVDAAERGSVRHEPALEQSRALSRPVPSLLFVQGEPTDPRRAFKAAEESISPH